MFGQSLPQAVSQDYCKDKRTCRLMYNSLNFLEKIGSIYVNLFKLLLIFSGACIIDRNGNLFKYLLDYLHGEVKLPEDEQTRIVLQEEADYFGIPYPYSLADHLANEMETYCIRSDIELKKVFVKILPYCLPQGWPIH